MEDDEQLSRDLLLAFQARFGIGKDKSSKASDTGVLKSAEFIYNNAVDVSLSMEGTKNAAKLIAARMQEQKYSTGTWSQKHSLHPRVDELGSEEAVLNFIFTMDLLNFSFWTQPGEVPYTVSYREQEWTGYWSLVAAMRRALDEDIPITTSDFWQSEDECTLEALEHVFRSCNGSVMPLLSQRLGILREAGNVLYEASSPLQKGNSLLTGAVRQHFNCSVTQLLESANRSAPALVNLLVEKFPSFRDSSSFEDEKVKFYKRAQIFVADVWACFDGQSLGNFTDIAKISAFADYRMPQMLHTLGCLFYSPPLESRILKRSELPSGSNWEVELRGCSIWVIELIRRQIASEFPDMDVNAVLIDFFLYDTVKELENDSSMPAMIPHHLTRSIWY